VARKAERPEAKTLLLYYVSINSTGTLEPGDAAMVEQMIAQGSVTKERLDLFRHQRLLNRVTLYSRKKEAAQQLGQLWENAEAPSDVRAEAAYEWGNFYRRQASRKQQVVAALSEAYDLSGGKGTVAEKALYRRGMVQGSVSPKQMPLFYADLEQLLARHSGSRLADDALYQIATEELFGLNAQPDRGFETFARLRSFSGSNDWLDSAYILPAIGYFDRGTAADLQAADRLLGEYIERYPDGVFRQRSLFWRGRIAERTENAAAANALFQQIIDEVPYDYYGLRSRLHREFGAAAANMTLPRPGSKTFAAIGTAYRDSTVAVELTGRTPYHDRLRTADVSGVYVRALGIVDGVGPKFRNRIDSIPLAELDDNQLIPSIALLLSLRQDVLAAYDADPTAENQLRLAGFAGRQLGDWPTAMLTIANQATSERTALLSQLQADPRYLATSYPGISDMPVLNDSLTVSAWPIDDSVALAQSLMYAVIRRESGYFPGAISPAGAIGLFQIMPTTFENRKNCWRWPGEAPPTPAAYLFNPERNVQFWSCWIQQEFAPKTRADLAPLIMAHNAGAGNLKEWRKTWRGRAIEGDLELQIESIRFRATQTFLRRVLTDTAIAESSGQFGAEAPSEGPTP
jgi:soluble lytic murein transglycosylase-like protein